MTGATAWEEDIPHLKIEALIDGTLLLTSPDTLGNGDDVVQVHPIHLRLMAEKMGLVREVSASDAEMLRTLRGQVADAARAVATVRRRMLVLKERVDWIGKWLCTNSDTQHADLDYEQTYANATCDICDEFCADLDYLVARFGDAGTVTQVAPAPEVANAPSVTGSVPEPTGNPLGNPAETRGVSAKACANPSGKALAKASVKPSDKGTEPLFGGDHE